MDRLELVAKLMEALSLYTKRDRDIIDRVLCDVGYEEVLPPFRLPSPSPEFGVTREQIETVDDYINANVGDLMEELEVEMTNEILQESNPRDMDSFIEMLKNHYESRGGTISDRFA